MSCRTRLKQACRTGEPHIIVVTPRPVHMGRAERANMQRMVDDFHTMFVAAVARNRDVATSTVRNGFGEGRMVLAADAVRKGMVDGISTLDQTLARLLGRRTGQSLSAAARRERELELLM